MPTNQKAASSQWRSGPSTELQNGKSAGEERIDAILHRDSQLHRKKSFDLNSSKSDAVPEREAIAASETEANKKFTVLVADDHPVVREGLVSLIDRQSDMQVVAQASNGREAVEKYVTERPDVALIDLRMPVMDGIKTVAQIYERDPSARVAIITSYQNEEDIYRALRAGALGFILKDATPDELARCIHAVARRKTWIPPQVGAMLAKRVADRELTPRETDVLQLVAAGKSNKEIGVAFDISEATVKVHITHILEKLKVTGRTEAINVAMKRGLVRLDVTAAA